jgi:hypothetical protein
MGLHIGVCGYMDSGKSTVARYVAEQYGFHEMAFADPLRRFVDAVNPIVGFNEDGPIRYRDAVELAGYQEAKVRFPEVRNILQKVGTEGARENFGQDFWVDMAFSQAPPGANLIFSDCRFPNEAGRCDITIWVDRSSNQRASSGHASENSLADWPFDFVILNDGSLPELYNEVDEIMPSILFAPLDNGETT